MRLSSDQIFKRKCIRLQQFIFRDLFQQFLIQRKDLGFCKRSDCHKSNIFPEYTGIHGLCLFCPGILTSAQGRVCHKVIHFPLCLCFRIQEFPDGSGIVQPSFILRDLSDQRICFQERFFPFLIIFKQTAQIPLIRRIHINSFF